MVIDNPFTKEHILQLVERKFESAKVDYKQAYPLEDKEKQAELVKDITAMANTIVSDDSLERMGFDPGYGFIIVGCDEQGQFFDISSLELDDAKYQQIVNEKVEPKVEFLFVRFEHQAGDSALQFGAFIIPPSERPPHRVTKEFIKKLAPGNCFVRHGTSTSQATDAELERMFIHRARFSEVERRLLRDDFQVSERERQRIQTIFAEPLAGTDIARARAILSQKHFLFIRGEMGVGKRTLALKLALDLVAEKQALRILRVSRFTPIQDLEGTDGAVIILPDVFGLFQSERIDIEKDISRFEELKKSNYLILTSGQNVLDEMLQRTRLEEWELLRDAQLSLTEKSWDDPMRQEIVTKHLKWAEREGRISSEQASWVREGLNASQTTDLRKALLTDKLPLDIRRFVDDRLPKLRDERQLLPAAREMSSTYEEILQWFYGLEDDQQCFLFVLSVFDGFGAKEIWEWYKRIADILRRAFHLNLATRNLALMTHSAEPYVTLTSDGKPTFAHPSFYEALLKAISIVYREYFLFLVPEFRKESVPADDASNEDIARSQPVRDAISTVAGETACNGIDDTLLELVEAWADHKKGRVRLAATEVLARAAENTAQLDRVLKILSSWTTDRGRENHPRRWTAVTTYGRLSQVAPSQAIERLRSLADDRDPHVRSGVPKALRPFTITMPTESQRIYTNLAADSDVFTRREVTRVLRTISFRQLAYVASLLQHWSGLESENRLWTLSRSCFIISGLERDARLALLQQCVEQHEVATQRALADALTKDDITAPQTWLLLERLISGESAGSYLVSSLAVVLEGFDSEQAWKRLEAWATDRHRRFRLAAAHVMVNLRNNRPDKADPLLAVLSLDDDIEVQLAAQQEAPIKITAAEIEALFAESGEPDGTIVIEASEVHESAVNLGIPTGELPVEPRSRNSLREVSEEDLAEVITILDNHPIPSRP